MLGENGAGKSTLIKCLTGVYRRDGGDILLDKVSIDPHSTIDAQALGIGTVYQEVNLLPNLSVAQNLLLGRQPTRFGIINSGEQKRQAQAMLAGYELDVDVARPLGHYSVAIQQLVAIARATALSGKVLILDEPTASLDAREVDQLFRIVAHLKARGLGIVLISHFLDQVFHISDRLTVLRNGRSVGSKDSASVDRVSLINLMLGHELQERTRSQKRKTAPSGLLPSRCHIWVVSAGSCLSTWISTKVRSSVWPDCWAPVEPRRQKSCLVSRPATPVRSRWTDPA